MTTPNSNNNDSIKYQIISKDRKVYTVQFSKIKEQIELLITEKTSLSTSYKASLNAENFKEINKFFRQFDTIDEIFEYINDLENIADKTTIIISGKFSKFNINLPNISKSFINNNLLIQVPRIELKENDLIVKLCEEVKKIDILENKIKYLFCCLGKNEKDFDNFDDTLKICEKNINEKDLENSKIVCSLDFILVSNGIHKNLNKYIKKVKLIYRASRDGDKPNNFHSKCDGKSNTVTFVKTTTGKKFGGFANSAWNSNGWINDNNVFVFSLDNNECYYYNNGYMINGSSSTGPYFGAGPDFYLNSGCLSSQNSSTSQSSFNYNGRNDALSGGINFQVEDYETYESVINPDTGKKEAKLVTKKKCVVHREQTDVKNTLWDGMALIQPSTLPGWTNGMALLRNHFCKACAFKADIQQFFKDYCDEHNIDYDTYEIIDMFGHKHLAKNIKMITTDNMCKYLKFSDLIGGSKAAAYEYWCNRVRADGCVWGIVKTDHPSKLGEQQQLGYQHLNSLPCTKDEIFKITETSVKYVESLKFDNIKFVEYLRCNANYVNIYDMLADLYEWNPEIGNSRFFRNTKSKIINDYVSRLKKGKITVYGDNLTVCGNPYALLLYSVGEDWNSDPTLKPEDGVIQVYTTRFEDGEYLCGIRNPHNSPNNLGYFKNVRHPLMEKYLRFSQNIMAVNCICTDIESRMNGEDYII